MTLCRSLLPSEKIPMRTSPSENLTSGNQLCFQEDRMSALWAAVDSTGFHNPQGSAALDQGYGYGAGASDTSC
jgi:hypothetical protein